MRRIREAPTQQSMGVQHAGRSIQELECARTHTVAKPRDMDGNSGVVSHAICRPMPVMKNVLDAQQVLTDHVVPE